MNAFPIIKVLTVVTLVLFSQFAGAADAQEETQESCNSKCENTPTACGSKPAAGNPELITKFNACKRDEVTECQRLNSCSSKSSMRELKSSCQTAFKDYTDARSKAKDACLAFDSTKSKETCDAKVKACKDKIAAFGAPFDTSDPTANDSGMQAMQDVATAAIYQKLGIPTNTSGLLPGQGSCVKATDKSSAKQDKKDKDRERKDLLDKIKTQKDEITKFREDLDKKRSEVDEELAKLEAENKKQILDKDKKSQEESAKISKNSVDVGKRLRALAIASTKEMQNLANVNFEYQSAMLELTDDKINQKCTQEFESLKAGLVNSKMASIPANASPDEKKQYDALAALAAQYRAKGIKGTGQMRTMLLNARKACFERSNTSRNKNKLINSQAVKNSQDRLDEIKSSMADENKNVALDQDNLKKLQDQTDKEKAADETEKQNKIGNLNKKLAALISTTTEKTKTATDKIAELTDQINKLTLVEKADVEVNYSDATEAINKGNSQRASAMDACGCPEDTKGVAPKGNEKSCSILKQDTEDQSGAQKKTAPAVKAGAKE